MTDRKTIALGTVWEQAWRFCRAEAGLLAPLALLGFGLPLVVLDLVMPEKWLADGRVEPGLWMLWIPPHLLFSLLGTLSISALTARGGISVREALLTGIGRMPAGIAVALLGFGAVMAVSLPVGIVAGIESALLGKPGPLSLVAYLAALVALAWLAMRLLPVWAAIAGTRDGGWAGARRTFALTRGLAGHMLLLRIVAWVSQIVVMSVVMLPARAIFTVLGRVTGGADITDLLAMLTGSAVAATVVTLWTVFVAMLYRQVEACSSGT